MPSIYDLNRSQTIFNNPVGKWALGTDVQGQEAALGGKWIGETPSVSYPSMAVQVPERAALETSPLGWLLVGALVGYVLMRPKKGFLEKLFG